MSEKTNSPILTEVHGAAGALHKHGIIGDSRMSEYDALCLDPVPSYTPEMISNLRKRWDLTQTAFARALSTSLSTVQKWETGASRKLLHLLEKKGNPKPILSS